MGICYRLGWEGAGLLIVDLVNAKLAVEGMISWLWLLPTKSRLSSTCGCFWGWRPFLKLAGMRRTMTGRWNI